jgi:acyl dehydratase
MDKFTTVRYEDLRPGPLGRYMTPIDEEAIANWLDIIGDSHDSGVAMSFALTWMLRALRLALGGIPAGGILARHELQFAHEPQALAALETDVAVASLYEKRGRPYLALQFVTAEHGHQVAADRMHLVWPGTGTQSPPSQDSLRASPPVMAPAEAELLVEASVSQEQIDRYADLSGDYNPLHVDPIAGKASPFGSTIAHGPITLGFLFRGLKRVYGRHWVPGLAVDARFTAPIRPGDQVRVLRLANSEFVVLRQDGERAVIATVSVQGGS